MKVFSETDLITNRERTTRNVMHHIEPSEKRFVLSLVNEPAYVLFDHYRTAYFAEAADTSDDEIATQLGWTPRKVATYRVVLEKANLIKIVRIGSGKGAITKLIVGIDRVALSNAGLPDSIQNHKAFKQIKRKLGVDLTQDPVTGATVIQQYYETHQDEFR